MPLKLVREATGEHRALVAQGIDPTGRRAKARREYQGDMALLSELVKDAFESPKAELKGEGKSGKWFSPLELHILQQLGRIPIVEIDQRIVRDVLEPISHSKAATAKKAAVRLNKVVHHGAALGLNLDLQVVAKAKALLGRQRHSATSIPSMPWQDLPAFYSSVEQRTVTHLALRFLILTGLRSAPVRFLPQEEI